MLLAVNSEVSSSRETTYNDEDNDDDDDDEFDARMGCSYVTEQVHPF